jgi:hypothetical protein
MIAAVVRRNFCLPVRHNRKLPVIVKVIRTSSGIIWGIIIRNLE